MIQIDAVKLIEEAEDILESDIEVQVRRYAGGLRIRVISGKLYKGRAISGELTLSRTEAGTLRQDVFDAKVSELLEKLKEICQ